MSKGGIGVGSASIVLVFAVLCLTIFAIISLTGALSDRALAEVEAGLIRSYYDADALAETILAEIITDGGLPDSVMGVDITYDWDWEKSVDTLSFTCPISDKKEFLAVVANDGSYDVLTWRMRDIGEWEFDDSLDLWPGFGDDDGFGFWPGFGDDDDDDGDDGGFWPDFGGDGDDDGDDIFEFGFQPEE